jgi:hypothetical protein
VTRRLAVTLAVAVAAACAERPTHTGSLTNDPPRLPGAKSRWDVFGRKGATWKLLTYQQELTVTVTNVREDRGQRVATLKWTLDGTTNIDYVEFNEIVWGPGGAWLTTQDTDLGQVIAAPPRVTEPPSEDSDPEHYVRWEDTPKGRVLCVGSDPQTGHGMCDNQCEGYACFGADGLVSIGGTWAPENMSFQR